MRLINHKYLNEIGITPVQHFYKDNSHFPRKIRDWLKCRKYQKIQMKDGFNPAETWDLEQSFYQWLYEGLRSYMDYATDVIDLDVDKEWYSLKYKGKWYTQRKFTEILLEKLEFVLRCEEDWPLIPTSQEVSQEVLDEFKKCREVGNEIHDMWKVLAPQASW